jgi:hypothetical protein
MERSAQSKLLKDASIAAEIAAKALAPLMLVVKESGKRMYASLWYAYIVNGAPYGETRKGLERWLLQMSRRESER